MAAVTSRLDTTPSLASAHKIEVTTPGRGPRLPQFHGHRIFLILTSE